MSQVDPSFVFVSCEHASRRLPDEPPKLGVSDEALLSHVAWDPGAQLVAQQLADRLVCPVVLGEFSRLWVDLNRSEHNPCVVPTIAFGTPVPGNEALDAATRADRVVRYHRPYWNRVRELIGAARHRTSLHLSVHSFTPEIDPDKRKFDIGLLFDQSRSEEAVWVGHLERALTQAGLSVRHNEPYPGDMDLITTAMRSEFDGNAYAGVEVEINHALMVGQWHLSLVEALARGILWMSGQL